MQKIIVIGGGAAGMMASIVAARQGARVTLLEQNEKLGKKLFITGKGRCNLTNASDMEVLFENVCTNSRFLYSAFYTFDNHMVMDFFRELGLELKVERGNRVFPQSDRAGDVIDALRNELRRWNVKCMLHTKVKRLLFEMDPEEYPSELSDALQDSGDSKKNNNRKNKKSTKEIGTINGVLLEHGETLSADAVIVATGGISYPSTGATGDGYSFAKDCGHGVTACRPALVPLTVLEPEAAFLQGLSLKNVIASIYNGKKKLYSGFGEMLFTHFGVSGPLILSASSLVSKLLPQTQLRLVIDLKPALSEEQLHKRILREFEEGKNKQFKNVVSALLPTKLVPVIIARSGISGNKVIHEITKEERNGLVLSIKQFELTVIGTRGYNEAIITQGGVSVKEIDPSNMQSKRMRNLYFAGEVLDLDAMTGGYNLQIAWSTGYLAGFHAAMEKK